MMETLEDPDGDYYHALPKSTRLFEYEIQSVLGQGGFGITYLATDTLLDESVAIKEYFPNESAYRTRDLSARAKSPRDRETFQTGLDAFLSEARIIARFRHRNIMQVRRFFEAHGTAYIVLQFEHGHSLETVVADAPLPEAEILSILSGILDGLEAVHERAILHRDIKPRNIIIRPDGAPVLIDFGAARDFSARDSQTVTKMASPGYSPPEQYGVGSQQGPWSDFYALGAVMYRGITGKVPADSLRRLRNDPLVPAVQIGAGRYSKPLLRVIDQMMRIDERDRPKTVAEIKAVLLPLSPAFVSRVPERRADDTKQPQVAKSKQSAKSKQVDRAPQRDGEKAGSASRRLMFLLGAGALTLALGAGGVFLYVQGSRVPSDARNPVAEADPERLVPVDPAKRPTDALRNATVVKADTAPETKPLNDFSPGRVFQDCPSCPQMVVVPAGRFAMGSNEGFPNEAPVHDAVIPAPFAIGTKAVTFAEWDACVADGGCRYKPNDQGWGRDQRPVGNVNWADVQSFLAWASKVSGHAYRLPTETEWEYAARAGTTTAYPWGADAGEGRANCADCLTPRPTATQPVGSYAANAFGLYDTAGNVAQWVADCWRSSYTAEPATGAECAQRTMRGGSFRSDARYIRSAARQRQPETARVPTGGFRIARDGP